jgi:hypothetical protein
MKKLTFVFLAAAAVMMVGFAGCSSDNETTTPTNNPPAAPSNLTVSQTVRNAVALSWTDNSSDEDTFQVKRSADSANWANVLAVGANVTSGSDATILANRKYWFEVRAKNSFGESAFSSPASIWTWPSVWNFSTDQTAHFTVASLEGTGSYHDWSWDAANQAGKLIITTPAADQHLVSVLANDTMSNRGWFESKFKVQEWFHQAAQTPSEAAFFIERDPTDASDNVVGVFISNDSTVFGYYSSGAGPLLNRLATNPQLPLLTENAVHALKFFHIGDQWTFYIDGAQVWSGAIANVANGPYGLYEEWQFNRGDGPNNQIFWVDDVANPQPNPGLLDDSGSLSAPLNVKPAIHHR